MLNFSERASIALEKSNAPIKQKLNKILGQLQRGEQLPPAISYRMNHNKGVWVVKVDRRTRLLYSITSEGINILDILDVSEYMR